MSFRRKNVVVQASSSLLGQKQDKVCGPGIRPSPLDGRPTTSTGTSSLDQLLAGHCGLPLGTSLLIEEAGATDFGGTLLRYFAAEGLIQGHQVHLLGNGDEFRRELPGLSNKVDKAGSASEMKGESVAVEKMRIAWRYEALGNASKSMKDIPSKASCSDGNSFCHAFDMTKRLEAAAIRGQLHDVRGNDFTNHANKSLLESFLDSVASRIASSSPHLVHRILIPNLLSPTLYSPSACQPEQVLQFLHGLRGLLRLYSTRMTALLTVPVFLHPRAAGLTRWMELLSDGIIELVSLPHQSHLNQKADRESSLQGLLRVHALPVFHERGGGVAEGCLREEQSFKLSASSGMVILPYSLPPVGDDGAPAQPSPREKIAPAKTTLGF